MTAFRSIFALLLIIPFVGGAVLLQIFLSKRERRWPGLVLPIVTFCVSLTAVLGIAAFTAVTVSSGGGEVGVIDESGAVVREAVPEAPVTVQTVRDAPALVITAVIVFLLYNIPTAILLAIYFACREKQRRGKALERMRAQDLA